MFPDAAHLYLIIDKYLALAKSPLPYTNPLSYLLTTVSVKVRIRLSVVSKLWALLRPHMLYRLKRCEHITDFALLIT